MVYNKDRQERYEEITRDWGGEEAIKQLDLISELIDDCRRSSWIILIAIPITVITVLRIVYVSSQNVMINEFKGTYLWKNWLVVLSSISYMISLKYLWPVLRHFWNFFHQTIDIEELGYNLWQFASIQAVIAVILHGCIAGLACQSFKKLPIFSERYEELKQMRYAWQLNHQAEIQFKARMIEQLPTILTTAISTQMNTILTALVLNEEQAQKLNATFPQAINSIMNSVMQQIEPSKTPKPIKETTEPEYDDY